MATSLTVGNSVDLQSTAFSFALEFSSCALGDDGVTREPASDWLGRSHSKGAQRGDLVEQIGHDRL